MPGVRLFYNRDLDLGETQELGYEATGRYGPIEVRLEQTFDFDNDNADDTLYSLTWEDTVSLEATGYTLVPPSFFGLEVDPESEADFSVSLRDETQEDNDDTWSLTYSTTYDRDLATLSGGVGGYKDTQLTFLVDLPSTYFSTGLGDIGFRIDFSAELFLADAELSRTYLNGAELTLFSDFFSRVGLQGNLQYDGAVSGDELTTSTLRFEEFGVTTRITNELYVSALLDDFWDLTGNNPAQSPYNFQPTLYVTWNRCCWALYGSLDTEDGTLSLALGFPGEEEGFEQSIDTPLALPRRRGE